MKVYTVDIAGVPHTMQLSDEDAKARGLSTSDEVQPVATKAKEPANKARKSTANKSKG